MRIIIFILTILNCSIIYSQNVTFKFHKKLSTWDNDKTSNEVEMNKVAISPNEKYLAAASGVFHIWDMKTGKVYRNLTDKKGIFVNGLAFSPDGKYLVLVGQSYDKDHIEVWDGHDFKRIKDIYYNDVYYNESNKATITSVCFSSNSEYMYIADTRGNISVWLTKNWELLSKVNSKQSIWEIEISKDDKTLITASEKGIVDIWDLDNGTIRFFKTITIMSYGINGIYSISSSHDNRYIATNTNDSLKIINYRSSTVEKTITVVDSSNESGFFILYVDFDPTGKYLATGMEENNVKIWDANSYNLIQELKGDTNNEEQNEYGYNWSLVLFSPSGKYLILSNDAGFIYIYKKSSTKKD